MSNSSSTPSSLAPLDRSSWKRVRLGDAFTFGNGYTPSKDVKKFWENGTIPWFRMEDIREQGRILKDSIQHITPAAVKGGRLFPAGSFILSTTATLGEYALIIADSLANQQFTFLIKNVNRGFEIDTMYFLQYLAVIGEWCQRTANAGGLLAVNLTDLRNYEFPLPSLPVQRRIASSLSAVDGHLASLGELVSKYEAIKKSTVSLLLRPQPTWQKVRLGDVAKVFRGGSPRPIQDYITSDANGINWIKIGDVATDAKYIEHTEEKIKPSGIAMSRQVKAGDFILSNSMSFGRPYILKIDGCIHDGWLTIQDYQATFEADYLYYLLGSEYVFAQYLEHAAGSSVKNLNKEAVGNLSLPVPPLFEQRRIVTALSSLDGVLASLAAEREKLVSLKRGLLRHFFG